MEWLLELNTWAGFVTLVALEVVLGIDNLIFIAILADKLPASQREKARMLGLGVALAMRLALLAGLGWLFSLNTPWMTIGQAAFTGRDIIFIFGGFFLVLKGTIELHERMEGQSRLQSGLRLHAGFWVIVAQILVLDALFSLDSVITAIGMVDRIEIMMAAVTLAIVIMLVAAGPLTRFITAHPTVVILCLGFLLMVGFALIVEGFGYHVPKGYLYAAIAFSIIIETLNQLARRNIRRMEARRPMRERTAEGILRMLGKQPTAAHDTNVPEPAPAHTDNDQPFGIEERNMVSGVLRLANRSIQSIMTPRADISWIDLDNDCETIRHQVNTTPHGFFLVCLHSLDNIIGIGRAKDIMADILQHHAIQETTVRPPILVHQTIAPLELMETLRAAHGQLVVVVDEFGAVEGLVTPMDLFEAIAGDFPDEDETADIIATEPGRWMVDGSTDLLHLEQTLNLSGLQDDEDDFSTLAGFLLHRFGRLPQTGDHLLYESAGGKLRLEILEMDGRRIAKVLLEQIEADTDAAE